MNTTTAPAAPLTLAIVVSEFYPALERDRDHTSFKVSEAAIVFEDAELAIDFLVLHKGLTRDRAELVLNRRCEFEVEPANGLRSVTYKFQR